MGRGATSDRRWKPFPLEGVPQISGDALPHDYIRTGVHTLHLLPEWSGLLWWEGRSAIPFVGGHTKCLDFHDAHDLAPDCIHQKALTSAKALAGARTSSELVEFGVRTEDGSFILFHNDTPYSFSVSSVTAEGGTPMWHYAGNWPIPIDEGVVAYASEGTFADGNLPGRIGSHERALTQLVLQVLAPARSSEPTTLA